MKELHEFGDSGFASRLRRKNRFRKNCIIGVLLFLTIAVCIGLAVIFSVKKDTAKLAGKDTKPTIVPVCAGIPNNRKFDCFPDTPISESECLNRGCCYAVPDTVDSQSSLKIPYCYYSSNYVGYEVENVKKDSRRIEAKLKRVNPSGFEKDVSNLNLLIYYLDDNSLRVKITDADAQRYEVAIPLYYQTKEIKNPLYNVSIDEISGLLTVSRKNTGTAVFKTDLSRLVYSDQFLQLSSDLPSSYIYGIGEHYGGILRSLNWTRLTLINSDLSPKANHGLYGSHPFYLALENDGKASGVFLFNSNIMDVILQPTPAITYRPIGGILDFFIMLGPSPKDVTQQYSSIVGKTFMPPFWSFGFHLCRYGYNSLETTKKTMQRTIKAGIPLDVQWNDIDYMEEYKDFTYDKKNFAGLAEFVDDLHDKGMHYVMITDPGISNVEKVYPPYDEGIIDDVFVKNDNGSLFIGKVWTSGTLVFPDFSHPAATNYWTRQYKRLYDDVRYDGSWIDMNEPSNFNNGGIDGCPNSSFENPQYVPGGNALQTKTLCMTSKHYYTIHYNEHNLYAYREAVATYKALKSIRNKRPFIISRASFAGQGVYGGHWSGDIFSSWEDLRYSIPSMINFNMYAMPMIGSDICGFNDNVTVELCARWQSLGAFYPFSRNHNNRDTIEQDPAALGQIVVNSAAISLQKRYTLLPYLYTLFYRSHVFGDTVIRPLFFEFPEDNNTYSIDEQFLWGSSLMIVPVLYPNTTTVSAYFPKGVWYDAVTAQKMISSGEDISLTIPISDIYLSIRGGIILASQVPAQTTTAMRKNPFTVAAAFDDQHEASGELYWDDGDSLDTYENGFYNLIHFKASKGSLNSTILNNGYKTEMYLQSINLGGLDTLPSHVTLNGKECVPSSFNISMDETKKEELGIFGINLVKKEALNDTNDCQFFPLASMFIIQTKPVSLLAPISLIWK